VVNALLEAGGRELVMMIRNDGVSCLHISAHNGHLEVVNAQLEAGGRELLMLTKDTGSSCLHINAQNGHLKVVKRAAGGRGARASDADQERWMQLPLASGYGERAVSLDTTGRSAGCWRWRARTPACLRTRLRSSILAESSV
jgi:hypothetical protein